MLSVSYPGMTNVLTIFLCSAYKDRRSFSKKAIKTQYKLLVRLFMT